MRLRSRAKLQIGAVCKDRLKVRAKAMFAKEKRAALAVSPTCSEASHPEHATEAL